MKDDPGLQRVWDARDRISKRCGYDVSKLIEYYKQKQKRHKDRLVHRASASRQNGLSMSPTSARSPDPLKSHDVNDPVDHAEPARGHGSVI